MTGAPRSVPSRRACTRGTRGEGMADDRVRGGRRACGCGLALGERCGSGRCAHPRQGSGAVLRQPEDRRLRPPQSGLHRSRCCCREVWCSARLDTRTIWHWSAILQTAFPGLPGWGAKSSASILSRYVHLESIPLDAARWDVKVRGAEKLAATLRARMGDALLFRFLAQLRPDVPITDDLADLEWRGAHREQFIALCDELGFGRLRDRPHHWAD